MDNTTPNIEQEYNAILEKMRAEIACDRGLHLDDDCSEIDEILFEEIEGTALEDYLT